jgi:hypothetical protein
MIAESLQNLIDNTGVGHRKESFELMIQHLMSITNPVIVETGCARMPGNWHGDGQSTLIFDRYINIYGGEFYSVDIDPNNVSCAKRLVSDRTNLNCSDSISWLWNFNKNNKKIDLLYLDSFDFDFDNHSPSMQHHLKEFCAILPSLGNTLIAVDDNWSNYGKGYLIKEFMNAIGKQPIYEGYQILWRWNE